MMAGIVMALFMKHSLSENAEKLTAGLYKVVAQIAETYVFVYLGMAFVSYPIFEHVDWSVRTRATAQSTRAQRPRYKPHV